MNQMSYATAKPLLDKGQAVIIKVESEVLGFGCQAIIKVDGKHEYRVTLSAAQKLALTNWLSLL